MFRLIYIDMAECTCIQIRTFEGIKTREKCGLLVIPRYVQCLFNKICYPHTAQVRPGANSEAKPYAGQFIVCKVLGSLRAIFMKIERDQ